MAIDVLLDGERLNEKNIAAYVQQMATLVNTLNQLYNPSLSLTPYNQTITPQHNQFSSNYTNNLSPQQYFQPQAHGPVYIAVTPAEFYASNKKTNQEEKE